MKKIFSFLTVAAGTLVFAQSTINFNGCHNLFENQDFIFTQTGVSTNNKKIYITTPVNGDQECGGLGTCEFKIEWNTTQNRWEFLADSGNGDFVNPYLIYYNSTGNSSALNPPSNSVGTWVENVAVTEGACGGNLTDTNSTISGDVHTSILGATAVKKGKIQMFPNPVSDFITIIGVSNASSLQIFNSGGQLVKSLDFTTKLNLSSLKSGLYILKVISSDSTTTELKFIKK